MQYLKTIEFNEFNAMIHEAKNNLENDASILILDDADKGVAKKKRTEIRKTIDAFKSEAKTIRDQVIGEFDEKVKQVVTVLDNHQKLMKEKVVQYDEKWKLARQVFVKEVINFNISEDIADFVKPMALYEERYLNATTTESKIKQDVAQKVTKIKSDLQVARAISAQVAEIFKQTLDVAEAIKIDRQQQEELARREAVAKAEAERKAQEEAERLARQKELERQAMVEAEIAEAKENGEVIDHEKVMEINAKANAYAEKEALKIANFTVRFEYKSSDYPMAWQNPITDIEERLQGLVNVEVIEND